MRRFKRPTAHKPGTGAYVDRSHPLARGLAGCWLLNEDGGTIVHDLSGHANHGTMVNMAPATDWIVGERGRALEFDAAGGAPWNRVEMALGALPTSPPYSMVAIFDVDSVPGASSDSVCCVTDFSGPSHYYELNYYNAAGNGVRFVVRGAPGGYFPAVAGELNTGVVHAVGVAHADDDRRVYVNGIHKDTNVTSVVASNLDVASIGLIGRSSAWTTDPYTGPIYYVAIYSRALPPTEIAWLYTDPYAFIISPGERRSIRVPAAPAGVHAAPLVNALRLKSKLGGLVA